MKRAVAIGATCLAVLAASAVARADDAPAVASEVSADLAKGAVRDAIDACEAYADRGGRNPDVSYDRGVAYVARVRGGQAVPGDLGRAAAAFEETLVLRPGDPDAERALEIVRSEVARRRARGGADVDVTANPSPFRAVVRLASETVWAILAAFGSFALTLGLVVRNASSRPVRLASAIAMTLGLFCLTVFGTLAAAARHYRETTALGVVVAEEARLLDAHGIPTSVPPLPEAARVDVLDRIGSLVHVRWGTREGYTSAMNVRVVRPAGSS